MVVACAEEGASTGAVEFEVASTLVVVIEAQGSRVRPYHRDLVAYQGAHQHLKAKA